MGNIEQSKLDNTILSTLPSPCWVLEEQLLENNLKILKNIKESTGISILLALKGYALWHSFDMVSEYLDGCCASGLHEAMLADEKFGKEVHTYSPAYKEDDIEHIASISHHMVFNSPIQVRKYATKAIEINPNISIGLRVNPELSSAPKEIYNPCGLYSRLGTTKANFDDSILDMIDGLHFHALCEESADALEGVLDAFEQKFGRYLSQIKWVNLGGGHHVTKDDYDTTKLISIINNFKQRYPHLRVYIEPGEAVGWETGSLVATVLEIIHNGIDIAILDISAEAHMPDTIIMPYKAQIRPHIDPEGANYRYRLAGNSCLAGDVMGDYGFDTPLHTGDKIIFEDQMHYTMVKATTFNGVPLPSIAILRKDGTVEIQKEFGYDEFKNRLG